MRLVTIYALCDHDGTPRYVGKSVDPRRRMVDHVVEAIKTPVESMTEKQRWLSLLLEECRYPKVVDLEVCQESQWRERERHWIAELSREYDLFNRTRGG